jgi:hypothetical protein
MNTRLCEKALEETKALLNLFKHALALHEALCYKNVLSPGIKSSEAELYPAQLKGAQMAEEKNFQVFEP